MIILHENHRLSENSIKKLTDKLSKPLPYRFKKNSAIEKFARPLRDKFKHFCVLGIGGSALGSIAIREALSPLFQQKLIVLDNIDPDLISEFESQVDIKKTLFIVISKSGSTPETIAQFLYFKKKVPKENFVIITDPKKGFLRQTATIEKIPAFEIPSEIGGRFSVLTSVGLLPAALLRINTDKLITGAKSAKIKQAKRLAAIQYLQYQKGKNISVMMPYSQRLFRFADWYRQLLAESIAKTAKIGITPVNALGATDQHSQNQLYMDGPNDKFFIFIKINKHSKKLPIPTPPAEFNYLQKTDFSSLLHAELNGTTQALSKLSRPLVTLEIPTLTPETLGELFMLFMYQIGFLGDLFGINAFDQPGVELSKNLTRKLLAKKP